MMRFEGLEKPAAFAESAEAPGLAWLKKNPAAKRPMDYWSKFKPDLADGFRNLCAYSTMYEPVGTIDHFVSWNQDRTRAYDWSNYRYASGWINSSKQNLDSNEVIDPFVVEDGWFEIILPSLQLVITEHLPKEFKSRATVMLVRLHLQDDERVLRQRREWYRMYQDGELTLEGLAKKAPLIAAAVRKIAA